MKFSSPEIPRSRTPRSSSNSSLPRSPSPSRVPSNTSPSMTPLPYSPTVPPVQAAFETSIPQDSKTPSQYSPHVSPQLSRIALNPDAYPPLPMIRSSNYTPRMASPLQNRL